MTGVQTCAAYDVPPPVVHILDRATFSNITEQMRSMYRDTMAPDLVEFEDTIQFYVAQEFDPAGMQQMRFMLDDVLRGDFETRAAAVGSLVQYGLMKPDEGRPLFDLAPVGGEADRLYANSAIQPLGFPAEQVRITAGDPANPLPLTPAEADALAETEQERQSENTSADSKRRTRDRNARRAFLRGQETDDEG